MVSNEIICKKYSVTSPKPFDEVLRLLARTVGRPDLNAFRNALAEAQTTSQLEAVVNGAIGPSGLMEFMRFDAGEVLRKAAGVPWPRMVRLLIGNPLVMKDMARTVPEAAAYAPITILVREGDDGVHLSYDSMASFIAGYQDPAASEVAERLDAKVQELLRTAEA
jgi:uncharacterized protein (DUF302 family)